MKLFDMKKQRQSALDSAEQIVNTAEAGHRDMTADETARYEMAMTTASALTPKISAIQSRNTMSQFFNQEGQILMDGGLASTNRNQKPMTEDYTNSFVAFLRSGGFSFCGGTNLPGITSPYDVNRIGIGDQSWCRFRVQTAVCRFTGSYWP